MRQQAIVGIVVLTGIVGSSAWAEGQPTMITAEQVQSAPVPAPPLGAGVFDFKIGMLAIEPFEMGEPVEDAPYSAEIVNEVTQELADGNRIERRTTGTVARDSRGRVRREHQLAAIGPVVPDGDVHMVTINDPVAGVHYALDPVRKVAVRSHPPRVRIEKDGHAPLHGRASTMIFKRGEGPEVGLEIGGEPGAPPEVRTEQLGTKEYEGVSAEGTRTIATLPAGAIGNVRPIEVVSERWYSPELGVVVLSRRADPRFGETVYRLTNIMRTEPDASLFQVPSDYKREDMKRFPFEPPAAAWR
jgi:hypothetical protein